MQSKLALSYLQQHPDMAIKGLLGFPPSEVAEYLNGLSQDAFDDLIKHIPVPVYMDLFADLADDKQQQALAALPFQQGHIILLSLPDEQQTRLMQHMSPTFQRLHRYYEKIKFTTVGKMMKTDCFTVLDTATVKQVKHKIDKASNAYSTIFVLKDNNQYLGFVHLNQIIGANVDVPMRDLVNSTQHFVNINHDLEAVVANPGWKQWHVLAVLDSESHFLGVIDINDIYQYIIQSAGQVFQSPLTVVFMSLAQALSELLSSLFVNSQQSPQEAKHDAKSKHA